MFAISIASSSSFIAFLAPKSADPTAACAPSCLRHFHQKYWIDVGCKLSDRCGDKVPEFLQQYGWHTSVHRFHIPSQSLLRQIASCARLLDPQVATNFQDEIRCLALTSSSFAAGEYPTTPATTSVLIIHFRKVCWNSRSKTPEACSAWSVPSNEPSWVVRPELMNQDY